MVNEHGVWVARGAAGKDGWRAGLSGALAGGC